MSRTLPRLLAGLAVAALALVGLEGALRLTLGPPPAPLRVYGGLAEKGDLEPTADGYRLGWQTDLNTTLPRDRPAGAPPAVYVAGGSTVHGGSGLDPREEFAALIGHQTRAETWNLGAPGLDSHDLVRIVDQVNAAAPPAVWVVYTGHNDLGNARFQQRYGSVRAGLAAHTQAALEHLRLYVSLSRLLGRRGDRRAQAIDPATQQPLTTAQVEAALRHLEANLAWLAWRTGQDGQRLVLVVPTCDLLFAPPDLPCGAGPCASAEFAEGISRVGTDPAEAARLLSLARDHDHLALRAPSSVGATLRAIANTHSHVDVVETERDLPREPGLDIPARRLFLDGIHLTAEGHREVARLVAASLAASAP
jgi:lysophospholipase L1-like esterase